MKNILITGGTGFIGSHLAEFFVKKNSMSLFMINIILIIL